MRRGSERTDVSFMLQVKHADSNVEVDGDEPPSFTLSSSEEELELTIVKVVHSRRLKACVFWLRPVCVCTVLASRGLYAHTLSVPGCIYHISNEMACLEHARVSGLTVFLRLMFTPWPVLVPLPTH